MNLTIHLSTELEDKLCEQAKASGKAPEEIALEALQEQLKAVQLKTEPLEAATLSSEQWVADVKAWATSHRALPHDVDDSRESIYAGRGE